MSATAIISGIDLQIVPKVSRNSPLDSGDLELSFNVAINESGCFTIEVELYHRVSTSPFSDPHFATNLRALQLPCQCFAAQEERPFVIRALAAGQTVPPPDPESPPRGGADAAGQPGGRVGRARVLPPMKGNWPEDDTRFGNTLDVYATIDVISCNKPGCSGNDPCLWIRTRELGKSIGHVKTDTHRVDVIDGVGPDKLEKLMLDAGKGGAGLIKMHQDLPRLFRNVTLMDERLGRLEDAFETLSKAVKTR